MPKQKSGLEHAMNDVRVKIEKALKEKHPDHAFHTISWFGGDAVVDLRDKHGEFHRYRWNEDGDNLVVYESANLERREVTHGKRVA